MFSEKISSRKSGILLYGFTPPKSDHPFGKIKEIADKTIARINDLDVDGLVIYDIQDESGRTKEDRPFPFMSTIDPYYYASEFLCNISIPKIIYRSVGKYPETELKSWIRTVKNSDYATVFVGSPSKDTISTIPLSDAYALWDTLPDLSELGGVTIFERHPNGNSEHLRIISKMKSGCSFFISQCIFNIGYAKDVLSDLYFYCMVNNIEVPTIIFTLTTCGSTKTLQFMDWLGINCPKWLKNELNNSSDILTKSIDLSFEIAKEITEFCLAKSIPFGINIESLSARKVEVEASVELFRKVEGLFKNKGVRTARLYSDEYNLI